jgi:hypothetical protein
MKFPKHNGPHAKKKIRFEFTLTQNKHNDLDSQIFSSVTLYEFSDMATTGARYEVFKAVKIQVAIFWVVMRCGAVSW